MMFLFILFALCENYYQILMQRINDRQQHQSINQSLLRQLHQYLLEIPERLNLDKLYRKFNQTLPQLQRQKKLKKSTPFICPIIFSPQSKFMIGWQVLNILIIYLYFLQIPIIFAFKNHRILDTNEKMFQIINIITICVFICGIFIKLNTSFYQDGLLKEDPIQIRKNYLKNTFIIDIISILAVTIYQLLQTSKYFDDQTFKIFVVLFFLKFFDLVTIEDTMNRSFDLNRRTKAIFKLLLLLMKIFLICNIVACSGFFISDNLKNNYEIKYPNNTLCTTECYWVNYVTYAGKALCDYDDQFEIQYVYSLYWASTTMISIGYGDITPKNPIQVTFTIVIQFMSCLLFGYSINQIWSIIQELNMKTFKINSKLYLINLYMRDKEIGSDLTSKVNAYLNNYYYSKNLRERQIQNQIISQLTPILRQQLYYQSYSSILKHKYFSKTNLKFKQNVCCFVKQVGYYEDQRIFMDINKHPCLYFVKKGQLRYSIGGKSHTFIKNLYKDDLFGIYQIFTQLSFKSQLKATQYSLLFCLQLQDFKKNIRNYKSDFERYFQAKEEVLLYNNGALIAYRCQFCSSHRHRTEDCLDDELRKSIIQTNLTKSGENQRKLYQRRQFKFNHRERYQKIKKYSSIKNSRSSQYISVRKNSIQQQIDYKKSKNVAKNNKFRVENMKVLQKIRKMHNPNDVQSNSNSEESLYEMRYQQLNIDVVTDYQQYYPNFNHKEFISKENVRRRVMRSLIG